MDIKSIAQSIVTTADQPIWAWLAEIGLKFGKSIEFSREWARGNVRTALGNLGMTADEASSNKIFPALFRRALMDDDELVALAKDLKMKTHVINEIFKRA